VLNGNSKKRDAHARPPRRSAVAAVFRERVVNGRRVGVDAGDGADDRGGQRDRVQERAENGAALVLRAERQVGQRGEDHRERDARDRTDQRHEQFQMRHRAGRHVWKTCAR